MSNKSPTHHEFLNSQISDCLKACAEAYEESTAMGIENAKERLQPIYADLLALSADFKLYSDILVSAGDNAIFAAIEERLQDARRASAANQKRDQNKKIANVFSDHHGKGGRGEDEDEVEFKGGDVTAGLICPLTGKLPKQPIVSRICHHVYEKDAILRYIRSTSVGRERKASCPLQGCNAVFREEDLYIDQEVIRQIEEARRAGENEWD